MPHTAATIKLHNQSGGFLAEWSSLEGFITDISLHRVVFANGDVVTFSDVTEE